MVPMNREPERPTDSKHSSPVRDAEMPLAIDEHLVVGDDMNADDDEEFSEDLMRFQARAARTIYHQPRADDDNTLNSTQSLYENDISYLTIDERRYCENYNMPNDDAEQERLQMLHEIFVDSLGGCLTMASLHNPTKILDIGTGTGEWAIAMAELYPNAEVTGTDIAKIQSTSVPSNVDFQIDDAEHEGGWTWDASSFDLVHFRCMLGAFKDWNHIYREAFKIIQPGGYIEVMDPNITILPENFSDDAVMGNWFTTFHKAARLAGRPMTIDHLDPDFLAAAGFTDIALTTKMIPCGAWASEKEERETGSHLLSVLYYGTEALSLRLFVEQLGWTVEDARAACRDVSRSIKAMAQDPERSKGYGVEIRVIVGRKPGGSERELADDLSTAGDSMRTVRYGDSSSGS